MVVIVVVVVVGAVVLVAVAVVVVFFVLVSVVVEIEVKVVVVVVVVVIVVVVVVVMLHSFILFSASSLKQLPKMYLLYNNLRCFKMLASCFFWFRQGIVHFMLGFVF